MNRIELSKNLYLDEYIPEEVYNLKLKTWGKAWINVLRRKINPLLISSDQFLRDQFGPVSINTWWNGGTHNLSGLRFTGYKPRGSSDWSDHFQGNASDKSFKNASAQEVRDWLKKSQNWKRAGVTIIEENVSWVHTSVSWTDLNTLKIVKP
ncbi:hypothetical protein ES705_45648 [subsurface metagenome]